jgi:hypothetical protein
MGASDKGTAPRVLHHPGARPTERIVTLPVDTIESSVFRPREASEDHHPHACTYGPVFLTYTLFDEAMGEEAERLEVVPCRRCASEAGR